MTLNEYIIFNFIVTIINESFPSIPVFVPGAASEVPQHVEEAGRAAHAAQGDHGGLGRRGQVRAHAAVHVRRVRRRLRAYESRQL